MPSTTAHKVIGALDFAPTRTSTESPACAIEGCRRKGGWRLSILGFPVQSTEPIRHGRQEVVCGKCADELALIYLGALGIVAEEAVAA